MEIQHLHNWPTTREEALSLQQDLAVRIDVATPLEEFELVAGCDVAYHPTETVQFAAIVVVRASDRSVVETRVVRCERNFPYIPGLLSFRELPALLAAFTQLRTAPDAVMVDGQGIAHPRRFGLASHLGLWLNLPCLGCAKSRLTGDHDYPGPAAGDGAPLRVGDETVGMVVRSAAGVKPVFVSPGHRIDPISAAAVVRATLSGYRLPTPTRAAHLAAGELRKRYADPVDSPPIAKSNRGRNTTCSREDEALN